VLSASPLARAGDGPAHGDNRGRGRRHQTPMTPPAAVGAANGPPSHKCHQTSLSVMSPSRPAPPRGASMRATLPSSAARTRPVAQPSRTQISGSLKPWLEGWSASVVAAEIGVTRNGVIGKVTRLEIRRPDYVWQDGPRSMIELKRIVASLWKGQSRKKIVGASPFSTRRRCSCEALGIGIFYAGAPPGALAVKRALNPAPLSESLAFCDPDPQSPGAGHRRHGRRQSANATRRSQTM
jgi:hypothetical protein